MTNFRTVALGLGVAFAFLASTAAAWADPSSSPGAPRPDVDVLFGSYHCGFGQGEGFVWATFQSTGDLVPDDFSLQRSLRSANDPQEVCTALTSAAREVVQTAGCSLGTNETRTDESGASIDFAFVCHDRRSSLTQTLADLGSSILLALP